MFRKVIHGEWIRGYSAMGCPSYGHYGNNPRYLLEIRELTTVKVRLQANKIDPVPSINVNIYEKHPTELFGKEVATSGPYTNVIQVCVTTFLDFFKCLHHIQHCTLIGCRDERCRPKSKPNW